MIAVAFALPHESQNFVAALKSGRIDPHEIVVIHTGMGSTATHAGLQQFWKKHKDSRIEGVIGAGFAGGLDPSLSAGTLVLAENYPAWLASARVILGSHAQIVPMASVPSVLETREAKAACARCTGAAAVDMESATTAQFCREKGLPFLALRVISDSASDALPVPSTIWFNTATQRPRPLALLAFLLRHPSRIAPFIHFIVSLRRSRRILTEALVDLVHNFPYRSRSNPAAATIAPPMAIS